MSSILNVTAARLAACCLGWMVCSGGAVADGTAPAGLPETDRRFLEQSLGDGVLGPAIPAPTLAEPVTWLSPVIGTRTYRLLPNGKPGEIRKQEVSTLPGKSGPAWRFRVPDLEDELIRQDANGDIVILGVNDFKESVATRYSPPKLLIPANLAPGAQRKLTLEVKVYDQKPSDEPLHTGTLDVVIDQLGAYRVKVPAGEFDAILIRSTTHGRVGPAKLEDIQYHFFAAKTGDIASVSERHVKAFGVYNSTVKEARVLATAPAP